MRIVVYLRVEYFLNQLFTRYAAVEHTIVLLEHVFTPHDNCFEHVFALYDDTTIARARVRVQRTIV